jgi:hypothetical protein
MNNSSININAECDGRAAPLIRYIIDHGASDEHIDDSVKCRLVVSIYYSGVNRIHQSVKFADITTEPNGYSQKNNGAVPNLKKVRTAAPNLKMVRKVATNKEPFLMFGSISPILLRDQYTCTDSLKDPYILCGSLKGSVRCHRT